MLRQALERMLRMCDNAPPTCGNAKQMAYLLVAAQRHERFCCAESVGLQSAGSSRRGPSTEQSAMLRSKAERHYGTKCDLIPGSGPCN